MSEINSPVLVPFGRSFWIVKSLLERKSQMYICPQYKFWGKGIELSLNNLPTTNTLSYIKDKYKEDFTGIVKRSKYYGLMKFLFNETTALTMDNFYQIDLEKSQKLILGLYLSRVLEENMDDKGKLKKPELDKKYFDWHIENIREYFYHFEEKNFSVGFVEELTDQKFSTIYDSIYRNERLYNPHYLGFVSLFTGEKERISKWNERLETVIKNNLIQGGIVYLNYPPEYEEKINAIMKRNLFEKIDKKSWRKPFTVKKINKGIRKCKNI